MIFFYIVVPPPRLLVAQSLTTIYAGSYLTINCSIELSKAVDTKIEFVVNWMRNGMRLTNQSHIMVQDIMSIGNSFYVSRIIFNPVQLVLDDGGYSCEVIASSESDFILSEMVFSSIVPISATGKAMKWCIFKG